MRKSISILGSTGSVGVSTLSIIDKKKNYFKVHLLSANKNFYLIEKQIKKYKPKIFVITNKEIYEKIKKKFSKNKIIISNTFNELTITKKNDITISAIPGIVGLEPTIQMVKSSKKILIANKESIICGWHLIKKTALQYNTKIIPIDSEHFSILKLLENHSLKEIKKIYITASGGPFLNYKKNQLKNIKIKDALNHPKWKMGKKITIDSSTLMNKILELIEAQKIFNIPNKKLDILIHPNSLVHAIIEMKNGLIKFLYHDTTMIIPLANAIFDGKININDFFKKKKKIKVIEDLYFKKVDSNIFPVIKLKDRLDEYPSTPIIINATNEVLVDQFLKKKIPFLGIYKIIMDILKDSNYRKYAIKKANTINKILSIDNWARNITKEHVKQNTFYN